MSTKNLTPQEPGVLPTVEVNKIDAIVEGTVGDLVEAIDSLGDDELTQLHATESMGKARTTALGAILREQQRRETDGAPLEAIEGTSKASLGDSESYARMHANEVDPRSLTAPVLTLDGWVLPAPVAIPLG